MEVYPVTRKFGLEVEFEGNVDDVVVAIRNAGLSTRSGMVGYTAHDTDGWVVKTDASVSRGGELVGPPLDWDDADPRDQINRAFAALIASGEIGRAHV